MQVGQDLPCLHQQVLLLHLTWQALHSSTPCRGLGVLNFQNAARALYVAWGEVGRPKQWLGPQQGIAHSVGFLSFRDLLRH